MSLADIQAMSALKTAKMALYPNTNVFKGNLFDWKRAIKGYYISYTTGNLVAQLSQYPMYASDFINVLPNSSYTTTVNGGAQAVQLAFYDSNKNYISGLSSQSTFTTPNNTAYIRISIDAVNLFSTKLIGISAKKYKISDNKMKNLVNKNNLSIGVYIDQNSGSEVAQNPSFPANSSEFIYIEPNTTYTMTNNDGIAFYDSNFQFISGSKGTKPVTSPTNARYIRVTVMEPLKNTFQLEKGNYLTVYQPNINGSDTNDFFKLTLPTEFCVAVGRTLEIYNSQICFTGNINNYHFSYLASVGTPMGRKWTFTPTSAQVGSYTLTIRVYDNNLNVVIEGTVTIRVVNKTGTLPTKNMLCIGDSLTDIDYWRKELKNLFDGLYGTNTLNYIGTKGTDLSYKHEGMSGWNTASFLANTNYTYGGNIILTVGTVTTIPQSKKQYTIPDDQGGHIWQFEKAVGNQYYFNRVTNGTYNISTNGTISQADSLTGDASITYTSWAWQPGNPFWNTTTNQLDFNNYLTQNSFSQPDIVSIFLGANDINQGIGNYDSLSTKYTVFINNFKTLIDKILSQWSGVKILLVLTPFYANQDGLGKNYGSTDGYFDIQQRLKVFTLIDLITQYFTGYNANLKIVPVAQTMDSDYAYTPQTVTVNPRSTQTVNVQTGGVHPAQEGFLQIADTIFNHIVGLYN